MDRQLRILHLTDPHLLADPNARLHGWQVEQAFESVLEAAFDDYPEPDALVLGGDLVDDESAAGYARLNARLAGLPCPVLAMAGNHDHPMRMAEGLTAATVHAPLAVGAWMLWALDSHQHDSEAGYLGVDQLAGFDEGLKRSPTHSLLFCHHPPVAIGSAWIDAMAMVDADGLAKILHNHSQVRGLFCGHAHQAHSFEFADRPGWITPATMRQFRPGSAEFVEDEAAPGYRLIDIDADGNIETSVHRVEAARRFREHD